MSSKGLEQTLKKAPSGLRERSTRTERITEVLKTRPPEHAFLVVSETARSNENHATETSKLWALPCFYTEGKPQSNKELALSTNS